MLDYVCTQAAAHLPGGAEEASGLLRSLVAAPALREQVVAVGGVDPLVQALQVAASPFADAGSDDSPADPLLVSPPTHPSLCAWPDPAGELVRLAATVIRPLLPRGAGGVTGTL